MRARSFSSWLTGLALLGLALVLTSVSMWGILGKHRLDDEARLAWKATRAICKEPRQLPCALPPPVALADPRPDDAGPLVLPPLPFPPAHDVYRTSPSRSPPRA